MSRNSSQWLKAMNDKMKYMKINEVWDLVELPVGVKIVGYKWVYKTKINSQFHKTDRMPILQTSDQVEIYINC
jgi:hypothetical protein